jgi:mannitol/fructose-specific phosphotransferase system IIA component
MKMTRLLIQVPVPLKEKLDALRAQGYTTAGYIRSLLERELSKAPAGQKGR